jgi:uncharacterized membrane protein
MRGLVILALLALLAGCGADPVGISPSSLTADSQAENADFCDAFAIVQRKCARCHADPPVNGAPFSLADYAAIQAPSPTSTEPERRRADRMLSAVQTNRMPDTELTLEPPVETLTCEERTTLLGWLADGAEPPAGGDTTCAHAAPKLLSCDSSL